MLHALIMAGGSGTRFWPASRNLRPKQLLDLAGPRSMIQETVDRVGDLVPPERCLVITNERLVPEIRRQLAQLPAAAILGEPCKRDTAPCVGLAAFLMMRRDPEAVMAVMPADHVITPTNAFLSALRHANDLVSEQPDRLVTFGVRPTYAAESFGYIEQGPELDSQAQRIPTYRVARFHEKPRAEVARQYLQQGGYFWNSGIFVWKAATILQELAQNDPPMHAHLARIAESEGTPGFLPTLQSEFAAIQGRSIDYAVMENAREVVMVEAPFAWDDVGSWQAIARRQTADADGNLATGRFLGIDTRNTIVRTDPQHLVVTIGIEDCVIVHTPDATLVVRRDQEENVRQAVKQLEQLGWDEYL